MKICNGHSEGNWHYEDRPYNFNRSWSFLDKEDFLVAFKDHSA